MKKTILPFLLFFAGFCAFAQDPLLAGLDAYAKSDWSTAILSFRKATTLPESGAEPWYWLIMAELSAEDYATALQDIDRFAVSFPSESRIPDTQYQKGRVLYILGRYEDSIRALYAYITAFSGHSMVPSGYYWIGECLFSVGRFAESRSIFSALVEKYPESVKREAAVYRISLIDETAKQDELLKLLKMSHEESLRIIEDYQRREKTYEQAINAYQRRISDMIKDTRLGELEKQLGDEKVRNSELLDRISALEIQNAELASALAMSGTPIPAAGLSGDAATADINSTDPEKRRLALEALLSKAQSLQKMYDQIGEGGAK